MALIDLLKGDSGTIRPGDAVFQYDPNAEEFQLHVGIYAGREPLFIHKTPPKLEVHGLPAHPNGESLGGSEWCTPGEYQASLVGRHLNIPKLRIKQIALISSSYMPDRSVFSCVWKSKLRIHPTKKTREGFPAIVSGTCSHYVELMYENAGLDLISQRKTHHPDPNQAKRIFPASQIHIFWRGQYPLRGAWDRRYQEYDACLFGARNFSR
jgi:hypothetical protein